MEASPNGPVVFAPASWVPVKGWPVKSERRNCEEDLLEVKVESERHI